MVVPRRWPAASRSSRPPSAGCRRRSGRLADGRRPGAAGAAGRRRRAGRRAAALAHRRPAPRPPCATQRPRAPATSLAGWPVTADRVAARARRRWRREPADVGPAPARRAGSRSSRVLLWRLGTGPFLDGPPQRRRRRRSLAGALLGRARHRLLRLAVDAGRPRPRGRRCRCPRRSPPTTARSSSTPRCPAASSATCTARCGTAATPGDTGRGLRAVVWERLAGQVVQVARGGRRAARCCPRRCGSSLPVVGSVAVVVGLVGWLRAVAGRAGRARRGPRRAPATCATGCWPRAWPGVVAAVGARRGRARRDVPRRRPHRRGHRAAGGPAAAGAARAGGDGHPGERRRLGTPRGRRRLGLRRRRARRGPGVATAVVYGVMVLVASLPGRRVVLAGGPAPGPRTSSRSWSVRPWLSVPTPCSAAACRSTATSTRPPSERLVLSNEADLDRVDEVRAECDAILVGAAHGPQRQPAAAGAQPARGERARVARGLPPIADQGDRHRAAADLDPAAASSPPATARSSSTAPATPSRGARARLGSGGHRRRRRRSRSTCAGVSEDLHAPRRAPADGRGRRHACTPSSSPPTWPTSCTSSSRRSSSATRGPAGSSATAGSPGTPTAGPRLAEVRPIGDVVLLRYALSPRFAELRVSA